MLSCTPLANSLLADFSFEEQSDKRAASKVWSRAFLRECSLVFSKMLYHILCPNTLLTKCSSHKEHFFRSAFCQRIWMSIFERAKEHSCQIDFCLQKTLVGLIHTSIRWFFLGLLLFLSDLPATSSTSSVWGEVPLSSISSDLLNVTFITSSAQWELDEPHFKSNQLWWFRL